MRYAVLALDVWGNENDGFEVNDSRQIGTIDVDQTVYEDDQLLIDVLNEAGYLDNATVEDVVFDGDESRLEVSDNETYRPLLSLVLEQ